MSIELKNQGLSVCRWESDDMLTNMQLRDEVKQYGWRITSIEKVNFKKKEVYFYARR